MANVHFAPIVEYNNIAASGSATIASGANFRVLAIYLAAENGEAPVVTISTVTDSATLFVINVVSGTVEVIDTPFLADRGLVISVAGQNCHVTVLRDHAGT